MNPNKEDSGWILCPSKSFPGKFYYFNVRNGEALWGSNDIENKSARKNNTREVADKSHCYPEPSSPPLDEYPTVCNVVSSKATLTKQSLCNIPVPNKMSNATNTNVHFNMQTTTQNKAALTSQNLFTISIPNKMSNGTNHNNGSNNLPLRNKATLTSQNLFNISIPNYMSFDTDMSNGSNKPKIQNNVTSTPRNSFDFSRPNRMLNISNTNNGSNVATQQSHFQTQKPFINVRRTIINQQKHTENAYQNFIRPPVFNEAVFPKYVSNVDPYMQNVIWTPIQMPRPMLMANTLVKTEMIDPPSWENRDMLMVQSCNIPLSKRFYNFEENVHKINEQTKNFTSTQVFEPTDVFMKGNNETHLPMFEPNCKSNYHQMKEVRVQSESFRTLTANNWEEKSKDTDSNFQVQIPFTKFKRHSGADRVVISNDYEKSDDTNIQMKDLNPTQKVPFTRSMFKNNELLTMVNEQPAVTYPNFKNNGVLERNHLGQPKTNLLSNYKAENKDAECLENLVNDDLRYLLMAKRRRSIDLGSLSSGVERLTMETSGRNSACVEGVTKKRVRFRIDEQNDDTEEIQRGSLDNDSQDFDENPNYRIENPSESKLSDVRASRWYIIPDTDAILGDFRRLDRLVQSDENCRLMLPHVVCVDIEDISTGVCREQSRVLDARLLLHQLATSPRHIICESPDENEIFDNCTDGILSCCLRVKEQGYVVLITNNVTLRKKANLNNIHTYTLQDVKDGITVTEMFKRVHAKYMNIQITLRKETDPNLFLQNTKEFPSKTSTILVNKYKVPLFENKKVTKKYADTRDSITSPINLKKLTLEERFLNNNHYTFDNESDTHEISVDMQNILIDDNCYAKKSEYQREINEFDTDLRNKNAIKSQRYKNEGLMNVIENEKCYPSVSTKQNEHKREDTIFPIQKTIDGRETTEETLKGKNILMGRDLRSKIHKPGANINNKTNDTNIYKDTNNNKENFQIKKRLMNKVLGSEIDKVSLNVHREVNIHTKCDNVAIQRDIIYNLDQSGCSSLNRINANVDEHLETLKNRLTKKVERPGIDCQNVTNSLDGKFKKFQVKNDLMAETIKFKIEELLCTYTQIMEEALSCLLKNSDSITNSLAPPWTLHEALTCIKKVYDNNDVRVYGDELTLLILNNSCKQGKLQCNVKPNDFMRMFGLSSLLIDCLKNIQPQCQDLIEAQESLNILFESITSSMNVDEAELTIPPPTRSDDELVPTPRKCFVKRTSDVVEWLDSHCGVVDNCKVMKTQKNDTNVVRTFGRNLNLLTINNTKSMTLNQAIDNKVVNKQTETGKNLDRKTKSSNEKIANINLLTINNTKSMTLNQAIDNKVVNKQTETGKNLDRKTKSSNEKIAQNAQLSIEETDNLETKTAKAVWEKNAEPKIIRLFATSTPNAEKKAENNFDEPTHGNTFNDGNNDAPDGPIIIRNIKLIDAFENKSKANAQNYATIDESFSKLTFNISPFTVSDDNTNNKSQDMSIDFIDNKQFHEPLSDSKQVTQNNVILKHNNDTSTQNNDIFTQNNNTTTQSNDIFTQNNNSFAQTVNTFTQNDDNNQNDVINKSVNVENANCENNIENKTYVDCLDVAETDDSGLECDITQKYTVLKMFLAKLSRSLKMIYKFIDDSIVEFRDNKVQGDKLKSLRDKAVLTHEHINCIIYKLKCIIQRELRDNAVLKDLLKSNIQAAADKRITRYRQVVTTCLEQAQILESALKIVISVADGDLDAPLYTCEQNPVYCNIFE